MMRFILGMLIVIAAVILLEGCAAVPPEKRIEFPESKICVYKPCRVV